MLNNNIKVRVVGKNINNFIKKIIKEKINIVELIPISHQEINLIISDIDYKKLLKRKSIYKITILKKYGKLKIRDILDKNKYIFIFLLIGLIIIFTLSRMIFSIDIIHTDKQIKKLLNHELQQNNLIKYTLRKNYHELEAIEDKILKNNKDNLEWIEITRVGTKYIVKVEERKIKQENDQTGYENVVSTKNAVITKITAISGEKVASISSYVSKGSVVISGSIVLPDGTTYLTKASGIVEGEVWYIVNLEYPYIYQEEILTGKNKNVYVIKFLNKRFSLFDFDKYNSFQAKPNVLLTSSLIPLSLIKERQYEVKIIEDAYTEEQIINLASDLAKEKLLKQNNRIINIKKVNILESQNLDSKVKIKFFISVIEDITKQEEIIAEKTEAN